MSVINLTYPKFTALTNNGTPLAGGKLYTYEAGTNTPKATYADPAGITLNPNPVVLDARGDADVFLDPHGAYKLVLKDASDNLIWTRDNYSIKLDQSVRLYRDYGGDLVAAITDIGTNNTTLILDTSTSLNQHLTIPDNIELVPERPAKITINEAGAVTGEVIGTGDGTTTTFSGTIASPGAKLGSVIFYYTIGGTNYTATVNNGGIISGTECSGTFDYVTGEYSLTFTTAPDATTNITVDYTSVYILTLNCSLKAGLYQIFDGDGWVKFNSISNIFAKWFDYSDIGITIIKAINASNNNKIPIIISENEWDNITYTNPIHITKPCNLIFPSIRILGNFLGEGDALRIEKVSGVRISGFAVSLLNNTNSNANGIYIIDSSDTLFTDGVQVMNPPQHGIVIDGGDLGSYQNIFQGITRIESCGGHGIIFTTTGSSLPNANSFGRVVLGNCTLSNIVFASGIGNVVREMYINTGQTWAVSVGCYYPVWIGCLVIDSACPYGITATSPLICGHLWNKATTKFDTGAADYVLYGGGSTFFGNIASRLLQLQNVQTGFQGSTAPYIYSSDGSGSVYPFLEYGNLIIEARGDVGRDIVFVNNGIVTAKSKRNNTFSFKRATNEEIITFTDGDTSPSVADSNVFKTANTAATSITTFDDGIATQKITLIFGDALTTIVHGSGIYLKGGVSVTPAANTTMSFVFDGTYWYEV